MSTDIGQRPLNRVTIQAPDSATEIFLIDGNFNLVPNGKGVGRLQVSIPSGLYTVKYKSSTTSEEVQHAITGDVDLPIPNPLKFSSPIPLSNTDTYNLAFPAATRHLHLRNLG